MDLETGLLRITHTGMYLKRLVKKTGKIFLEPYALCIGWIALTIYHTADCIRHGAINNYQIFKYSFFNALQGNNLYATYPEHYFDTNHYGPLFSLLVAPFALIPGDVGMYLFQITNTVLLFYAIQQLPLDPLKKMVLCLICTQELIILLEEFQTNGAIAAFLILAWVCVEKKKDFWAGLFICLGLFIKLYGIIGLAFFFLSKNKRQFTFSLVFWSVVLFVLPMLVFSPQFIANSYLDWYHSLVEKNALNVSVSTIYQDVSVMGMVKRITGQEVPTFPFLLCGSILFLLSCYKINEVKDTSSRLLLLSSSLLFIVLFSTSSELVTYILAFAGIGIWIVSRPWPLKPYQVVLFLFALYCGSLFPTDAFPAYIKTHYIKPYALKALPCLILWITIIIDLVKLKLLPDLRSVTSFSSRRFQKDY